MKLKWIKAIAQTSAVALVTGALVFGGASLISGHKSGPQVLHATLTASPGTCAGPGFCISSNSPALSPLSSTPTNLLLSFTNPLSAQLTVTTLTVTFTKPSTFPASCPFSELTLNGTPFSMLPVPASAPGVKLTFSGSTITVPQATTAGQGSRTYPFTLALPDNGPQDACQSLQLGMNYAATAQYTEVYGTSTAVTSSQNPSSLNQAVTYTATVTGIVGSGQDPLPNSPTGFVTFYDGTVVPANAICSGKALTSASVSTSTATCSPSAYTAATTHPITAVFANTDGNFSGSTSPILSQVVSKAMPTNVVSDAPPTTLGSNLMFTATVTGMAGIAPTGPVTWTVGGTAGATSCTTKTSTLSGGTATCVITASKAGTYAVSDLYGGDGNYMSVPSNTFTMTVTGSNATGLLVSLENPTTVGSSVTYVALFTGSGPVPTGTVTFEDGGKPIASCTSSVAIPFFGLWATCTLTYSSTVGSPHSITALYSGNSTYGPATSNIVLETVTNATPSNVVTNSGPTSLGSTVKFTATVTGPGVTPTGTVSWTVSGLAGANSCGTSMTLSGGVVSCTVTVSNAGTYKVSETYSGNGNYTSASSNVVTVSVAKATPTNVVTTSGSTSLGSTVKFTAAVGGPGTTPSGTVIWKISGTAGVTSCGPQTTTLSGGTATCSIIVSKAGTYAVSDSYGGDGNYTALTSNTDTVTVAKATPTNVVTNSTPTTVGSKVTFTATVGGPSGGATPSGTVAWTVSGTAGVTSCGTKTTTLGNSGTATCTITLSKAGTYVVSDSYVGDGNYLPVSSKTDSVS